MNKIKARILKVCADVIAQKETLGDLDSKSGDGDLGMSMEAAFSAIRESCQAYEGDDLGAMLMKAALACNRAAPSTMGTLISSGIMSLAKTCKGQSGLEDDQIITLPRIFTEGVQTRGKAKLGDKTILDALLPMCDALEAAYADGAGLQASFAAGAAAADKAAEATRGMQAKTGRAKWLGKRAAEHPDAGAKLCAIAAQSLAADL